MAKVMNNPQVASIWIDEALEELDSYNTNPFVEEFMSRFGLKRKKSRTRKKSLTKEKKLKKIRRCIHSSKHQLKFDALVAYLDELKPYGRQLIFLWRLKPREKDYLLKISDENYVRGLLRNPTMEGRGAEGHLNSDKLIWRSPTPELAEVRHSDLSKEGLLRFKWVATRTYFVRKKDRAPNTPPIFKPKTQRAVTFFAVDLRNGDSELRIPSLPNDGIRLPTPREEFEKYRREVEKFIELDRFAPVLIEPVAKHFLREPVLPITRWKVSRAYGSPIAGGVVGGQILPKLLLAIGEFFAHHITVRWACKQRTVNRSLHFSLDGHGDSIKFGGIDDASRINFVLDEIRHYGLLSIQLPQLRQLVEEHPEYSRIISSMDYQFARLMKLRVDGDELSKEVWYPKETILKAFRLAVDKFPEIFSMSEDGGDVLVMSNKFSLSGGAVKKLKHSAVDRGKRAQNALIEPVMTIGYLLLNFLSERLVTWVLATFFKCLTGIPFIVVDIVLVLFIALLHAIVIYGKESVRGVLSRLLKGSFTILRWLAWSLRKKPLVPILRAVEKKYVAWEEIAVNGSVPSKYALESRN